VRYAAFAPRLGITVTAIDLPTARRLVISVVLGQVTVTLMAALLAWALGDARTGWSAALGGGISTVACLAMAVLTFGGSAATDPQRAMRAFYLGEAAKVVVVVVLFVVVLRTIRVVPLAMLGAYIATFFVFWVALANALPTLGGRRPGGSARLGSGL
jgi:F0F1-type ATP synthase assembly protein I